MHIIEFLNLLLQNQIFYRIQSAVTINVTIKYTYNRNFKLTVTKSDKNYKHLTQETLCIVFLCLLLHVHH